MTPTTTTCHLCHPGRTMPDVALGVHLRIRHPDIESGLENTTIGDSPMSTDPYAAFVAARIADDEAGADKQHEIGCDLLLHHAYCNCGVPDSIRDWCTVARRFVGIYDTCKGSGDTGALIVLEQIVRTMAWPDRRHPDYPGRDGT